MREERRLALARRQLLLAHVARREAMAALADAVQEEDKSARLAARSAELVRDYDSRPVSEKALALREHAAFVHSLQTISQEAGQAYADARDQSRWQSRSLAEAQSRADRMEQKVADARRGLGKALERREATDAAVGKAMARKLLKSSGEADAPAPGTQSKE